MELRKLFSAKSGRLPSQKRLLHAIRQRSVELVSPHIGFPHVGQSQSLLVHQKHVIFVLPKGHSCHKHSFLFCTRLVRMPTWVNYSITPLLCEICKTYADFENTAQKSALETINYWAVNVCFKCVYNQAEKWLGSLGEATRAELNELYLLTKNNIYARSFNRGEFPTRGEFCIYKGGILYLGFCLKCNIV